MERHILQKGKSSCPISSSWCQGVLMLAPPCKPYYQRWPNASDRLRIPGSTLDSDWTDCLYLTTWFSYHMVPFQLHTCPTGLTQHTAITLFTNHNVTAFQSTWSHQERTQNPCQQLLYNNISLFLELFHRKEIKYKTSHLPPLIHLVWLVKSHCRQSFKAHKTYDIRFCFGVWMNIL